MNLRLAVAAAGIPTRIKKRKLGELISLTASAFGCAAPDLSGLSYDERLEKYALFTKAEAAKLHGRTDAAEEVRRRLFEKSLRMGAGLRREFRVRSEREALKLMKVIYRAIGIDMRPAGGGEVAVSRCFFSRFYDGPTCRVISALDEGIAAGISAGGALHFKERLTEGRPCCRADFRIGEKPR